MLWKLPCLLLGALSAELGLVLAGLALAAVLAVAPLALAAATRLRRRRPRTVHVPEKHPFMISSLNFSAKGLIWAFYVEVTFSSIWYFRFSSRFPSLL